MQRSWHTTLPQKKSENPNDVLLSVGSCGYVIKLKDVKVSHVTESEYGEQISLGGFFEGFSVTFTLALTKTFREVLRTQAVVEVCMCVDMCGPSQQNIFKSL